GKGSAADFAAALHRHAADGIGDAQALVVHFQAGVQPLGVLAKQHQINTFEARIDAGRGLGGAHVLVQVVLLAQGDVHALEALADGRGHGAFQAHAGALQRVEQRLGQQAAAFGQSSFARVVGFPLHGHLRGGKNINNRTGDFRPNAAQCLSGSSSRLVRGAARVNLADKLVNVAEQLLGLGFGVLNHALAFALGRRRGVVAARHEAFGE
nr:hypothetical protein [Tanacetum cinerariifolium]